MIEVVLVRRLNHLDPDRITYRLQTGSRQGSHVVTIAHSKFQRPVRCPVCVDPECVKRIPDVVLYVFRYGTDLTEPVARLNTPCPAAEVGQRLRRESVYLVISAVLRYVPRYELHPVVGVPDGLDPGLDRPEAILPRHRLDPAGPVHLKHAPSPAVLLCSGLSIAL